MNKKQLIEELRKDGFSKEILNAFSKVKREDFIPNDLKQYAYENEPLPIGQGQTISQPYTIAFMLNLLELDKFNNKTNNIEELRINKKQLSLKDKTDRKRLDENKKLKILEIGSGSGYVLALMNEFCKNNCEIIGIERIKQLTERSKEVLNKNENIKIVCGDGSKGIKGEEFDRILISASSNEIPRHLYSQLDENGIIVASVRNSIFQIKKEKEKIKEKEFPGFVFVPLVEH